MIKATDKLTDKKLLLDLLPFGTTETVYDSGTYWKVYCEGASILGYDELKDDIFDEFGYNVLGIEEVDGFKHGERFCVYLKKEVNDGG